MLKKFCPLCGKETETLKDSLCPECSKSKPMKKESDMPASVKFYLCECTSARIKNSWIKYNTFNDAVASAIKAASRTLRKRKIRVKIPKDTIVSGKTTMPVTVAWSDKGDTGEENIDVIVIPNTCPVCSRKSGGYYEAIIQLRGSESDTAAIHSYIEKKIAKQKSDNIFMTRTEKAKNGIDIYVSSIKFGRKIAREIQFAFKIDDYKESFSNYGAKDGKMLKRATYLLRCPQN